MSEVLIAQRLEKKLCVIFRYYNGDADVPILLKYRVSECVLCRAVKEMHICKNASHTQQL